MEWSYFLVEWSWFVQKQMNGGEPLLYRVSPKLNSGINFGISYSLYVPCGLDLGFVLGISTKP